MLSLNKYTHISGKQNKGRLISKVALGVLLAILPVGVKTEASMSSDVTVYPEQVDSIKQTENNFQSRESIEISDEQLFKDAVKEALLPITDLRQIPEGGVVLHYAQQPKEKFPDRMDFFPKEMFADKLPYSIIVMGEWMFIVTPSRGFHVDTMYMDKDHFHLVLTGGISVIKDKKTTLLDYLYKIHTQREFGNYFMSSIRRVPISEKESELKKLNALNIVLKK